MVLFEGEGTCYWTAKVMLLFHLKTIETLDLDIAKVAFLQNFDIEPPLDNVDIVQRCAWLLSITMGEFDKFFQ